MRRDWFALLPFALFSTSAFGSSVFLDAPLVDFRVNGVSLPAGNYEARWGQIIRGNLETPDQFIVFLGNQPTFENDGWYFTDGAADRELSAVLYQTDNVAVPAGVSMGLALTTLPDDSNFGGVTVSNTVVLFDPSWISPIFTSDNDEIDYTFTSRTIVAYLSVRSPFSTYSYNGGQAIIDLKTVPEPSAFAFLGGFAALGFSTIRRRSRARNESKAGDSLRTV